MGAMQKYTITKSLNDRLFNKIEYIPESGCWLWVGAKTKNSRFGYGIIKINGKTKTLVHRLSWEIFNGLIPSGVNVLHHCDTPTCINPNHLFLGTQKDNVSDMFDKKRNKTKVKENLMGIVFGKWVVIGEAEKSTSGVCWLCMCQCGRIKPVSARTLKDGSSKSCGSIGCTMHEIKKRKISREDAENIKLDNRKLIEIAEDYPVGISQIANIKCGLSWK